MTEESVDYSVKREEFRRTIERAISQVPEIEDALKDLRDRYPQVKKSLFLQANFCSSVLESIEEDKEYFGEKIKIARSIRTSIKSSKAYTKFLLKQVDFTNPIL